MKTLTGKLDVNAWEDYTVDGVEINLGEFVGQHVVIAIETVEPGTAPGLAVLDDWPDEPTRKEGSKPPREVA